MSTDSEQNEQIAGGSGGLHTRGESGRSALQETRMTLRAVREGWLGSRWPTHATPQDFQVVLKDRGELTLKERACLAVFKGLNGGDERINQIAAKTVVAMEAQNQADERGTTVLGHQGMSIGTVVVMLPPKETDDPPTVDGKVVS